MVSVRGTPDRTRRRLRSEIFPFNIAKLQALTKSSCFRHVIDF
jgi:hypothetical protein